MDLYSASRRFARPFEFDPRKPAPQLPLGARGLIGDGHTAALVRPDGAIDWLCFPRFDSPSVFGALLDPERGGLTAVTPTVPFESLQAYDPDTNVLETLFMVPGQGVVRLTDFMPWSDDPRASIHEVHRRIECREGAVELEAVFDPRFDYGEFVPEMHPYPHGVLARAASGVNLGAVLGNSAEWEPREGGGVKARFQMRSGQRQWLVIAWDARTEEPLAAYRPFEMLRTTRHHWREWSRKLSYDGPWRHHVMRSALALKLMIYAPTGAMVAAPTTSLPEWIGGVRNWDYRYAWTRDTALGIRAANRIGYVNEAREFFHFMRDALDHSPDLKVMYGVDGESVPQERELAHLAGFQGSRPVRVGNDARDQVQLDTAGALLDAAFLYEQFGGSITLRAWRHLRRVVESVSSSWTRPDHGIWEPRKGVQHNVHSKLMSWVALDRGMRLAARFGDFPLERQWAEFSGRIHADVTTHGLSADGSHFVSAYGSQEVDAALLLLPTHGFLPADDPRVEATIDEVRRQLGSGSFLYRYRADDGVGGAEGAFVLCGFWLAEVLAMAGRLDEAHEVFTAHAEASNHLGLLAEEVDPVSGALLGNFPQAFSHLGLVNAAIRIDREIRKRDETPISTSSLP